VTFETTIQMLRLRGDAQPLDPDQWKWLAGRFERALGLMKQWLDAMERMDDRCAAAAGKVSEEEFNRIVEEEEAKVAALRARLEEFIEGGE
jgi:hypothetical protein